MATTWKSCYSVSKGKWTGYKRYRKSGEVARYEPGELHIPFKHGKGSVSWTTHRCMGYAFHRDASTVVCITVKYLYSVQKYKEMVLLPLLSAKN